MDNNLLHRTRVMCYNQAESKGLWLICVSRSASGLLRVDALLQPRLIVLCRLFRAKGDCGGEVQKNRGDISCKCASKAFVKIAYLCMFVVDEIAYLWYNAV